MLSNKIKNMSVYELEQMIKKDRVRPLKSEKIIELKTLIHKRKKELEEFIKKLFDSRLFKLAKVQLAREGKTNKIKMGTSAYIYNYDAVEVLLMMSKIIKEADKRGIKI